MIARNMLVAAGMCLLPACGGDGGGDPVLSILARGVQFVPSTTLISEQYRPSVRASGSDVFFSDATDAPLKWVSIQGGAISSVGNGAIVQPLARFTLWGGMLLVADGALIKAVPFSGGPVTTLLAAGTEAIDDIATDGTSVLVGFLEPSGVRGVRRIPLDGGTPVDFVAPTYASHSSCLVRVAQDRSFVYWLSTPSMQDTWLDDCAIWRAPIQGGPATLLREGPILDFALSGEELFFLELSRSPTGSGQLKRISIDGGSVTELSAGGLRVAVDAAAVFVGSGATLTIASRSGAPATSLSASIIGAAVPSNAYSDLSVAPGAAYLADPATGTVICVAPVP
ncbi:MAG TPA: hypothetical protein VMT11_17960 [Myxococcaceae bacterium]|nr:hypothetical protein [Myxococcaceae bacterium]